MSIIVWLPPVCKSVSMQIFVNNKVGQNPNNNETSVANECTVAVKTFPFQPEEMVDSSL